MIYAKARLAFSAGLFLAALTIPIACASELTVTPTFVPTATFPTLTPQPLVTTLVFLGPTPSATSSIGLLPATFTQARPMYSFENFSNGWAPQAYYSTIACIQVSNSSDIVKDGQYSLEVQMNLIGNDEQSNRGEVWVDMRNYPPFPTQQLFVPLDLKGHTITMWVFAPTGAIGDSTQPNGFQIFVKDIHWNGSYSSWTNIVENEWIELSFAVTDSTAESGFMEEGFDPRQIIAVGLKMGAGGSSTAIYQGPIFIDAVDW
ncbi:MAG: hypothetical protein CNIPEHKO_00152 [Anaerolineales bacterium]|nr:hypothetical protein [Anaerolineales bacterium]